MEYSSISLRSIARSNKVKEVLIAKSKNTTRFSKIRGEGLDTCKIKFFNIYPMINILNAHGLSVSLETTNTTETVSVYVLVNSNITRIFIN